MQLADAGLRRSFSGTGPMMIDAHRELAGFCEWLPDGASDRARP